MDGRGAPAGRRGPLGRRGGGRGARWDEATGAGRTTAHRSGGVRRVRGSGVVSAPTAGAARCGTQCAADPEQIDGAVGHERGGLVGGRPYAAPGAAGGRPVGCVHRGHHLCSGPLLRGLSRPRAGLSRLPNPSSGPVVTWGTPPRCEGCRSASQGLSLTLLTVLGRKLRQSPPVMSTPVHGLDPLRAVRPAAGRGRRPWRGPPSPGSGRRRRRPPGPGNGPRGGGRCRRGRGAGRRRGAR